MLLNNTPTLAKGSLKTVLVLGAGLVAKPTVDTLANTPYLSVIVADINEDAARSLCKKNNTSAVVFDSNDIALTKALIAKADLVISLLPPEFHVAIVKLILESEHKPAMLHASYLPPELKRIEKDLKKNNCYVMNEIGLDPGLDHIAIVKAIREIKEQGGVIKEVYSLCGSLCAPEDRNIWGMRTGWSPRGIMNGINNPATIRQNYQEIYFGSTNIFTDIWTREVAGITYEVYANRPIKPYIEQYGLEEVETVIRGTLRYPGWTEKWLALQKLGYTSENNQVNVQIAATYAEIMAKQFGLPVDENLFAAVMAKIGVVLNSETAAALLDLGLFDKKRLPEKLIQKQKLSLYDVLESLIQEKWGYEKGQRDIVVMEHIIIADFNGKRKEYVSRLIEKGAPTGSGGYSAIAKTVGIPLALTAINYLKADVEMKAGLHYPTSPETYEPLLKQLAVFSIEFEEKVFDIRANYQVLKSMKGEKIYS